jgi:activating signal cointegrator 1
VKAITLWQPWASLWLTGAKIHETRSWPTKHRGSLAVHAAKRDVPLVPLELHRLCEDYMGLEYRMELPLGAVLGVIELVDCVPTGGLIPISHQDILCGDFSADRWAWRRGQFVQFEKPIDCKGRQGLWNWPCTDILW